jgi:hypothetical protein
MSLRMDASSKPCTRLQPSARTRIRVVRSPVVGRALRAATAAPRAHSGTYAGNGVTRVGPDHAAGVVAALHRSEPTQRRGLEHLRARSLDEAEVSRLRRARTPHRRQVRGDARPRHHGARPSAATRVRQRRRPGQRASPHASTNPTPRTRPTGSCRGSRAPCCPASRRQPVPVPVGPPHRRPRDAIAVEPTGGRSVSVAVEVLGEDPAHHGRRRHVDHKHTQPEPLGRLARARAR